MTGTTNRSARWSRRGRGEERRLNLQVTHRLNEDEVSAILAWSIHFEHMKPADELSLEVIRWAVRDHLMFHGRTRVEEGLGLVRPAVRDAVRRAWPRGRE